MNNLTINRKGFKILYKLSKLIFVCGENVSVKHIHLFRKKNVIFKIKRKESIT